MSSIVSLTLDEACRSLRVFEGVAGVDYALLRDPGEEFGFGVVTVHVVQATLNTQGY